MAAIAPPIEYVQQHMKGIAFVVLATLAFGLADTTSKHLIASHPVPVVLAVRYLVNVALLSVFLGPRMGQRLWRVQNRSLVFVRGLCLAFASLTMGLALRVMPLGETVAILYLAPFLVMLLAIPLLGEKVRPSGWFWAAVGFSGVLLIVRPGGGLDPVGVVFALINACLATAYHLLTRKLAGTESTVALLYQTAVIGSVFFCVLSLGSLADLSVGLEDLALMGLLGLFTTLGHYCFTAAYREAPASLLAPINYLHLAWAAGFGWLIFGHIPDALGLSGMVLICVAGAAVAMGTYRVNRRA